ncbi:hypothetical protein TWF718_010092 [Orbilia javanica]|uniref:Uncharacterized protein n=1 Tax=Orbilia javanica TaxID=47235 RepID=A0AAN8MWW8_9PEZI
MDGKLYTKVTSEQAEKMKMLSNLTLAETKREGERERARERERRDPVASLLSTILAAWSYYHTLWPPPVPLAQAVLQTTFFVFCFLRESTEVQVGRRILQSLALRVTTRGV